MPPSITGPPNEDQTKVEQDSIEQEKDMTNESLVADASGRTVVLGGNRDAGCTDTLVAQGFANAADRHLVDVVRDSANRTQSQVQDASSLALVAIERTAAASALATLGAELRLSQQILKEGCETRALIASIDANRIRDDLASANAQLLALRVQLGQPV